MKTNEIIDPHTAEASSIAGRATTMVAGMLGASVLVLALAIPGEAEEHAVTMEDDNATMENGESERLTAEKVQDELDDAFDTISEYSAEQRDEALAEVRENLDKIDAEIAQIEQRTRENWADMSEATQERTRQALENLRERRNELSEAYGAMAEGAESAWGELQDGLANAWSEVGDAWGAVFDGSDESMNESSDGSSGESE